jgi:hypothetical protein
MMEGGMTQKTHVLNELKKYSVFALSKLDMASELHFKNSARKWSFKTYIYKQKMFAKILQIIIMKVKRTETKEIGVILA